MKLLIETPDDWNPFQISKNKKFIGRTKKVLNPTYKNAKELIAFLVHQEMVRNKASFEKSKIWIKIKVIKKSLKGDCSNLIEGVCDAVKTKINVDDNFYSVLCDWEIGRPEKIFIEIYQ